MIQLAYTSVARSPMGTGQLVSLLQSARYFNQLNHVTGLLLYKDKSFFQIIEGHPSTIDRLMLSIAMDYRHHTLNVLYRREISFRDFADWTMGYINIDTVQCDIEAWGDEEFKFPLQGLEGDLTHLMNVSAAMKITQEYSRV